MALQQVRHLRLERLAAFERTIEGHMALCAILMRYAQDCGDRQSYHERKVELARLQTHLGIYRYLIGREWERILDPTGVGRAIRVAFGGE